MFHFTISHFAFLLMNIFAIIVTNILSQTCIQIIFLYVQFTFHKWSLPTELKLILYYIAIQSMFRVVMLLKRNSYFRAFYAMVNENYRSSFFLKALKILTISWGLQFEFISLVVFILYFCTFTIWLHSFSNLLTAWMHFVYAYL